MSKMILPENNPHYEWSDELGRYKRKAGTHSGARQLQRNELLKRKEAIDRGEYVEPTTQNSFYYHMRKVFLANGIDPSIEGKNFRNAITNQIDDICKEWRITREDLLIIADVRATLYYRNEKYHVSLKNIESYDLSLKGTDIIIIEKAALCELLAPLAASAGIALLDTKGYVVEYAKKLSDEARIDSGNIAMLSDWDTDGLLMAYDVYHKVDREVYRIGIDFDTIEGLKEMYPEVGNDLEIDRLQEPYTPGTSLERLAHLEKYGQLSRYSVDQKYDYNECLGYLSKYRIEIDSVQNAVGYQKLWAFILKKLEERFPERNYNRAIQIPGTKDVLPDIFLDFQNLLIERLKPERYTLALEIFEALEEYKGIKDNIVDDEIALKEYFKTELNDSNIFINISYKIKDSIKVLKEQNIQSFMESTF